MTATVLSPETKRDPTRAPGDPTATDRRDAAPAKQAIRFVLRRGVADVVRGQGEEAITVELTLEFDGLVVKHAIAYPGASEPTFGYSRVRVEDIDVWWRQRVVVPGREPVVTPSIRPHRVTVGRIGRALSAVADYA